MASLELTIVVRNSDPKTYSYPIGKTDGFVEAKNNFDFQILRNQILKLQEDSNCYLTAVIEAEKGVGVTEEADEDPGSEESDEETNESPERKKMKKDSASTK